MSKISLSGSWELTCDKEGFSPIEANVPGDNASALLRAGLIPDPNVGLNEHEVQWIGQYNWRWKHSFTVDRWTPRRTSSSTGGKSPPARICFCDSASR